MSRAFPLNVREVVTPASKRDARRLPPGVGLAVGALASLGLWAGLIHVAIRLF